MRGAEFVRFRQRQRCAGGRITMMPGDSIKVIYHDWPNPDRVLVEETVDRAATYDEAAIFEAEVDGRPALGGMIIEAKR